MSGGSESGNQMGDLERPHKKTKIKNLNWLSLKISLFCFATKCFSRDKIMREDIGARVAASMVSGAAINLHTAQMVQEGKVWVV